MKSIRASILSVLIAATMVMPVAYAEQTATTTRQERRERMEKAIQEIYSQLNLTEDQKQQLEVNKQNQKEQMKASLEALKAQKDTLHQELMKADLDMNKVNAIQSQVKTAQAQVMDNRLASILEVRKILTPEQFSKFITLMKERKSMGKGKGSKDEKPE